MNQIDASLSPGSRRARLAAAVAGTAVRPITTRIPANDVGVALARQIVARSLATFGSVPAGTSVEAVDTEGPGRSRVRGEWVRGPGVARNDAAVLYLHGSAYTLCSPKTHRGLVARLSVATGLPVFCLDYRLAPRHPFPAASEDVARAFRWLVEGYHPAERLVLAGDSAGGHLAVDLCLSLIRSGQPLPSAQALFSPLIDLTLDLAARREQVRPDPMISAAAARRLVERYTGGLNPRHARLALVPAAGEVLPPTLIQAGGREMLAADAHHLHRVLTAGGTDCRLEVWPDQMHVFQALPRLSSEAGPALDGAGAFLRAAIPAAARLAMGRTA